MTPRKSQDPMAELREALEPFLDALSKQQERADSEGFAMWGLTMAHLRRLASAVEVVEGGRPFVEGDMVQWPAGYPTRWGPTVELDAQSARQANDGQYITPRLVAAQKVSTVRMPLRNNAGATTCPTCGTAHMVVEVCPVCEAGGNSSCEAVLVKQSGQRTVDQGGRADDPTLRVGSASPTLKGRER